jgi:hypothetical protein
MEQTNEYKKTVHIISGGTVSHVRTHLALAAVAYGATGRRLRDMCEAHSDKLEVHLHLTRMANAGRGGLETVADVAALAASLKSDARTKMVFMCAAMADYNGSVIQKKDVGGEPMPMPTDSGKYAERLHTKEGVQMMLLEPAAKVLKTIREGRKDIFLVGFKTTAGATEQEQYLAGLDLLKSSSCNLVFANDVKTRLNMVITPEEARYHVTDNRNEALQGLVEMAYLRSHLTFTRSTVVSGEPVAWDSPEVPAALRKVVDHCVGNGAYKVFRGATVGHFACKVADNVFLTSKRKTNFNDLAKLGLVKVVTDGPDHVTAFGHKPSVGGQSQRIIFNEHPGLDCIVHFHCPMKPGSKVPVMSQREYECGSHECGQNTSNGLARFEEGGNVLHAVMLDNHGPNIVFGRDTDPDFVIRFIEENFDLAGKTGGPVSIDNPINAHA